MTTMIKHPTKKNQTGAVLIVSLVMLMLVTLIGVSGMQTTILEERMSSNYRDQNTAFQAAEATLLIARTYILNNTIGYSGDGGLLDTNHDEEPKKKYYKKAFWTNANSTSTPDDYGEKFNLLSDPRYIIKKIDQVGNVSRYRVTARAEGASPGTQVILEAIYERTN